MNEDARRLVVVTSDVHVGSKYCAVAAFVRFLRELPPHAELVLAGDVVDHARRNLAGGHAAALAELREASFRRPVVWVRGNHDERFAMADPGRIVLAPHYAVGSRVYIAHGNGFDAIMPHNRLFILTFRAIHRVRVLLGAESVHVARYAKNFPALYRVLCNHIARNATGYARQHGYGVAVCGHTHFAEDRVLDGVRYINTGAWTERPPHALWIEGERMDLRPVPV